jgi:hypothetical protein
MLERYIGVKSVKADINKRNLSYSIVNIIRSKNLRALKRLNKGKKYNNNTFKNRSNRIKKLALLSRCFNR